MAAEQTIAAQRDSRKIVVEIKKRSLPDTPKVSEIPEITAKNFVLLQIARDASIIN